MSRSSIATAGVVVSALLVLALGLVACGARPAYLVELPGSQWTIEEVDGQSAIPSGASIRFLDSGGAATLALPCGEVWLAWAWESSSTGHSFGINRIPPSCESAAPDRHLLDYLLTVEGLSATSDDAITLVGSHNLSLLRQPTEP